MQRRKTPAARVAAPRPAEGFAALGSERAGVLSRLGLRTLSDVLAYPPLDAARTLMAAARGDAPPPDLPELVSEAYAAREPGDAPAWPVRALRRLGEAEAATLAEAGVASVADLAELGAAAEAAILAALADNGFSERPSAPAALLPGLVGAIASSVRFTTFVRDTELRKLTFKTHEDCVPQLAISPDMKHPGSLSELFTGLRCPVLHLGYMCDHRQRWINLGTHLGEVVHSLSLAPGESRNIAVVNWRRRQLTALEEHTTTSEQLTATFVQNRALSEITSAVAREHQAGATQTEANTAATAASFVGAGALVGGLAGGGTGAAIGAAVGSVVPGLGTAIGAVAGGLVGAAVGGASGVAAGGLVHSGTRALGVIEADTNGDRSIVADVQQRIQLTTSQTASSVRSLWSSVVVEDAQSENVEATTSNVTNYNHMHALNIEYFEVLQHYLARIELLGVKPVMFLPFSFLDFTSFRFIRDYWDAVRVHVEDEGLRAEGDAYFVTEQEPAAPDLVPVPPPLDDGPSARLDGLRLQITFVYDKRVDIGLKLILGDVEVEGVEDDTRTAGDVRHRNFNFPALANAEDLTKVAVSISRRDRGRFGYTLRVLEGEVSSEGQRTVLSGDIATRNVGTNDLEKTYRHDWDLPGVRSGPDKKERLKRAKERAQAQATNAARLAAFETLRDNIERFRERLQRLILRRRHFFTRVILTAIEPEELTQLLEAVRIGHQDAANPNFGIPLSELAHTVPLGMSGGGLILKLKRLDQAAVVRLAQRHRVDLPVEELVTLFTYAHETILHFEDPDVLAGLDRTDHVYVPTGGLFAEAILGRANGAEYLDLERWFNWQDSPIPHQPPAIAAVSTDSRFQAGDVSVTVPEGDLQVINPVSFPDPTGLPAVLGAVQNGALFRDMSKSGELAGMIGSLSALAGQMGQAAATLTGNAAQQAMAAAAQAAQAAASLAQGLGEDAFAQSGAAFKSMTEQGAALVKARELEASQPPAGGSAPSGQGSTSSEIVRGAAGLPPRASGRASRTINVRLRFISGLGSPIPYDVLSGLGKTFRLFHENDIRDIAVGSSAELNNPIYVFPLVQWSETNGELSIELDYGAGSFKASQTVDFPPGRTIMIVNAAIATRDQQVTRNRTTSRTQALSQTIQEKFGVTAQVAAKLTEAVTATLGGSFEDTGSSTDSDSTTGSTSTTVVETLPVPTGALKLEVQFRS